MVRFLQDPFVGSQQCREVLKEDGHHGIEERLHHRVGKFQSVDVRFRKSQLRRVDDGNSRSSRSIRHGALGMDIPDDRNVALKASVRMGGHDVLLKSARAAYPSVRETSTPRSAKLDRLPRWSGYLRKTVESSHSDNHKQSD